MYKVHVLVPGDLKYPRFLPNWSHADPLTFKPALPEVFLSVFLLRQGGSTRPCKIL